MKMEPVTPLLASDVLEEGGIGMGAVDTLTWLDKITVSAPTSSIATSDPVFAKWDDEADDLLI